jgi:hypothetical protein
MFEDQEVSSAQTNRMSSSNKVMETEIPTSFPECPPDSALGRLGILNARFLPENCPVIGSDCLGNSKVTDPPEAGEKELEVGSGHKPYNELGGVFI